MKQTNITIDQFEILLANDKRIQNNLDNMMNQLDLDRTDIERLKIDQSTIKEQLSAILTSMSDFKKGIRTQIEDTIREEIAKSTKKELSKISLARPGKVFIIQRSFGDWIRSLFNR